MTQLTDGEYTDARERKFWVQKSTVGWRQAAVVVVTLDLAGHCPIRGLSFSTASGGADVAWPAAIEVLVSVDGKAYHFVGDLVSLSKAEPPSGSNVVHRFQTDRFRAHGRYVKLVIHRREFYVFVDEIEVFRGEDAWKELALPGKLIRYPRDFESPFLKSPVFIWSDDPFNAAVRRRIDADLEQARLAVINAALPTGLRNRLMAESDRLQQAISELPKYQAKGLRAVFPLNDVHARVYGLHGSVRKAQGRAPLVAWQANPWDFLQPVDLPPEPPAPRIDVAAMRGETRAGAVNLTNCTDQGQSVQITFEGLPGGATPAGVTVREVAWTDTFQRTAIAAALPVAERDTEGWRISVPAGMTRQVWFEVTPKNLPAGAHAGGVVIRSLAQEPLRVPFTLRVFDLDFPKRPTLHVSGWEYTDTDYYGVTPQNRAPLIAHLQERYVDSPWAGSWSVPFGTFNADGTFETEPDTSAFDAWIEWWPQARCYFLYNYVTRRSVATDLPIDDPLFATKVGTWIRFWVAHARERGIDPSRLHLLLVDEPNRHAHDRVHIAWAKAVKAAEPKVVIFCTVSWKDPTKALPGLWSTTDLLCPSRPTMLRQGKPFETFYRQQKQAGKRLALYSVATKMVDPYAGYRLQAWTCFDLDAEVTMFWAFGSPGGRRASSWNEYALKRAPHAPLFISPRSVTAGKHMEAVRESVEDFEYLVMLRDRVQQLTEAGSSHALLPRAQALLRSAARRVLTAEGANELKWKTPKDRTVADAVWIEIGEILEKLR